MSSYSVFNMFLYTIFHSFNKYLFFNSYNLFLNLFNSVDKPCF